MGGRSSATSSGAQAQSVPRPEQTLSEQQSSTAPGHSPLSSLLVDTGADTAPSGVHRHGAGGVPSLVSGALSAFHGSTGSPIGYSIMEQLKHGVCGAGGTQPSSSSINRLFACKWSIMPLIEIALNSSGF